MTVQRRLAEELEIHTIATGVGFAEGPTIMQNGDLIVTSLDHGCLYRVSNGEAEVFADTGGSPNGATEGIDGVYVAQAGGWWAHNRPTFRVGMSGGIQRVAPDGAVTWLTMDPFAPSDVAFGPDGLLYFSDATRGRFDDGRLWRMDVASGQNDLLVSVPWFPNGIAFGPEPDMLYVAVTRQQRIVRFPIGPDGLGAPETAIQMSQGEPDGFAFDDSGHITIGVVSFDDRPGNVQTWDLSTGKLVDTFSPGDGRRYTNVAITIDRRLVITDATHGAVQAVPAWPHAGLELFPFRKP